jgi:hypothetical protein
MLLFTLYNLKFFKLLYINKKYKKNMNKNVIVILLVILSGAGI